jgi:hypothetical protein
MIRNFASAASSRSKFFGVSVCVPLKVIEVVRMVSPAEGCVTVTPPLAAGSDPTEATSWRRRSPRDHHIRRGKRLVLPFK